MSYAVSQRAQELGIRMTLGAERRGVLMLVLRQGMLVVGNGLPLGLLAAFALTRLVSTLLFVSPADPLVFAGMALTLVSVRRSREPAAGAARHDGGSAGRAAVGVRR
jgi:ABC-type antimicrobial peptide transport system permease subunit